MVDGRRVFLIKVMNGTNCKHKFNEAHSETHMLILQNCLEHIFYSHALHFVGFWKLLEVCVNRPRHKTSTY